jgi:hypothetical protein
VIAASLVLISPRVFEGMTPSFISKTKDLNRVSRSTLGGSII